MTTEELKNIIADSKNVNWFNNINETINFKYIDFKPQFTSVSALFEFINEQFAGWQKISPEAPVELVNLSLNKFQTVKGQIEHFISITNDKDENQLTGLWQAHVKTQLNNIITAFTYNSPEVTFLSNLNKKSQTLFNGAFHYITGNTNQIVSGKDSFDGALLAYEFLNKNGSTLAERISKENESLSKLKEEFQIYLNRTEEHLTTNLNEGSNKVKDFVKESINYKNAKEEEINNWFKITQGHFDALDNSSTTKIKDLEKTYEELLRLKKPAEYWEKRATKLKSEGQIAMWWLIGLVAFGGICLYVLLWQTPEGMLTGIFDNDKTKAIRWSIVFITFISLIFVGVRILSKVMFSSFHLSRDAEERQQLTYVYLALIKESAIDPKERDLIMQSLFSRADTGLLKEDSSPTMPGGMDKFIK
jgi:putative sterol carrier protein